MLFLKKSILIFFLVMLSINSVVVAELSDSGFVGYVNRPTSITNISTLTPFAISGVTPPNCVFFENIEEYGDNIDSIYVHIPFSSVYTHTTTYSDYNLSVNIRGGVDGTSTPDLYPIVGTGMCWYTRSDDTNQYYVQLSIDSLSLGSASGDYVLYIEGMNWNGLEVKNWNGANYESTDPLWCSSGGWKSLNYARPAFEGVETRITTLKSFQNAYYAYENYNLNINKTIGGTPYYSKIKIEDGVNGIILNESTLSTTDIWVSVQDSGNGTTIYYEDSLGDTYTSYPSFVSTVEDDGVLNVLSGTVVNAVDNTLLDGVEINLSSKTGYAGDYGDISSLGFYEITGVTDDNYNLSTNYTSFEQYQRDLELTEDLTLTIPLIPTDLLVLGTNLSGVYGIVSDHYTEQPISNAIVRIENSTYSDFTSTNNNGYYEFVNITAGNYTIEGNKVEYYPYQQKNLTTITNDMLIHNFDMVLLVEPVDSTTEDLEDALGLDEVTEDDILHFLKTYGFWLFMLALFFFMYAAYKSSGLDRWFK